MMVTMERRIAMLLAVATLLAAVPGKKTAAEHGPHPVVLTFHLSNMESSKDADAIAASLKKLKTVTAAEVDTKQAVAVVRFDSHHASYHQMAQGIADAGTLTGKSYDPCLHVRVPEYTQGDNAGKIDAIFAGKRLNDRVTIEPLDKAAGRFAIHFKPLKIDPDEVEPQGFNGGHLNHPIHDPPPKGLGLTCIYEGETDDGKT
jgi:copper chaperone CopZ